MFSFLRCLSPFFILCSGDLTMPQEAMHALRLGRSERAGTLALLLLA